jgi:hypothetical protein
VLWARWPRKSLSLNREDTPVKENSRFRYPLPHDTDIATLTAFSIKGEDHTANSSKN